MGLARDRGLEDGQLYVYYTATNQPGVFTFADALFNPAASTEERIRTYVASIAKGESFAPALRLFTALEKAGKIGRFENRDKSLQEAESA